MLPSSRRFSALGRTLLAAATLASLAACARTVRVSSSAPPDYELWAMDQGTNVIHIFDASLREVATIDVGSQGARVPHMLEFTPDFRYAFIANPATGNVAVIRADDRKVVSLIPTGPRTHHAAVARDGRRALVSVIGAPNAPWDGKIVELILDVANERFTIGRTLVLADDPLFAARKADFKDTGGAVCLAFTGDGRYGYVTLGPALDEGGVVVLDTRDFKLVSVFAPKEVDANCGTILSPTGEHMYLVGGDRGIGVWHAADTRSHKPVHKAQTRGHDAHGSALTPDGREYWLVNRVTSNAVVIDTRTRAVLSEIPFVGKTPDIVAISPDSRYAFITLRGPNPVTMPHLAVGETPGFAVFDVKERKLLRLVEPAKGNTRSDFHGVAVRLLQR
jgi:DNA-binding beta-propeller fold protein YncE